MPAKQFHQRLSLACDNLPDIVPPLGQGRQVFIARKLKVTQEAVRKWLSGDARPRVSKMKEIAKLLDVDEAWLALGIEPELDRREKRVHNEKTEGGVYVMFGLLTMNGGHCAFPGPDDLRAEYVDFYAILRGVQSAYHICIGREVSKNVFQFQVPRQYNDVKCIGVVQTRGFRMHFLDLRHDLIDKHRQRKGGGFQMTASKVSGKYHTGSDTWRPIDSVGDLV